MRKNLRLTEGVISQDTIATATKAYANMNQVERDGWISSILKCIEDMGYGKLSRADIITGGFGIGLIISGIKLNIPELCAMGALTIGALVHFEKDVWKKIIECARNKRKGVITMDNTTNKPTPEKTVQESRMKKTIRLTESELVKLVQRIIKEDEMMGNTPSFNVGKTVKDIINTRRFNTLQEGMMVSIKNNKLTILPRGAEGSEEYVIDLTPKTHSNVMEQQTKIIVNKGKLIITLIDGEKIILDPSMKVIKFNP
jgi:hypothetical protein